MNFCSRISNILCYGKYETQRLREENRDLHSELSELQQQNERLRSALNKAGGTDYVGETRRELGYESRPMVVANKFSENALTASLGLVTFGRPVAGAVMAVAKLFVDIVYRR